MYKIKVVCEYWGNMEDLKESNIVRNIMKAKNQAEKWSNKWGSLYQ